MKRRTLLIGTALVAPVRADAQDTGKVARIGFLGNSTAELKSHLVGPFREGLRDLGYAEGKNIAIEYRWGGGKIRALPSPDRRAFLRLRRHGDDPGAAHCREGERAAHAHEGFVCRPCELPVFRSLRRQPQANRERCRQVRQPHPPRRPAGCPARRGCKSACVRDQPHDGAGARIAVPPTLLTQAEEVVE